MTAASDAVGLDPRRGRLIVLAGPSGVGKSSVVAGLRAALPELYFSVSATTRDPRAGEVDGRDYRFVGPAGFSRATAVTPRKTPAPSTWRNLASNSCA